MALEQEALQLRHLKLKLGVNRVLSKMLRMYASDLRRQLMCKDEGLYTSVVDELAADGLLLKEIGKNGALLLRYATPVSS